MRYTQLILSLFCSTETDVDDSLAKHIDEILNDWKGIRIQNMGWFFYNTSKANIIEVIDIPGVLEVLPILGKIKKETFLLVIVYHLPYPLSTVISGFVS